MATVAIDTLRYAKKIEQAGVERPAADAMADALNDELAGHVATKADLESMGDRLEVKFAVIDARFAAIDARFEAIDARFEAIDARFEAMEARFEAMEARFDSLAASLKVTNAMMIFGFTLLAALGVFQLTRNPAPAAVPVAIEQPAARSAPEAVR